MLGNHMVQEIQVSPDTGAVTKVVAATGGQGAKEQQTMEYGEFVLDCRYEQGMAHPRASVWSLAQADAKTQTDVDGDVFVVVSFVEFGLRCCIEEDVHKCLCSESYQCAYMCFSRCVRWCSLGL